MEPSPSNDSGPNILCSPSPLSLGYRLGAVSKPDDELMRRRVEELLRDLSPGVRETVRQLIENYKGEDLERRLRQLIGVKRTLELLEGRR